MNLKLTVFILSGIISLLFNSCRIDFQSQAIPEEYKNYIPKNPVPVSYKEIIPFHGGDKLKIPALVTKEQALEDIDMFEYLFSTSYAGYEYWESKGINAPWRELVSGLVYRIKGNPGLERIAGLTLEGHVDWVNTRIAALDAELGGRAENDDLAACLRLAARAAYDFKFRDKLDPTVYRDRHPGSRLLAFQTAVSPSPDAEKLI